MGSIKAKMLECLNPARFSAAAATKQYRVPSFGFFAPVCPFVSAPAREFARKTWPR